jgi:squalene-hopene cyclase-like protein/prenyltransferase/squalene oxidase-like repeat protein
MPDERHRGDHSDRPPGTTRRQRGRGTGPGWSRPVTPADALLAEVAADEFGAVSPSVYETGRLVADAPWLDGHRQRVTYLLRTQRSDGGWGGPDGYDLVPTLSATEALLVELARDPRHAALGAAADRGLGALFRTLHDRAPVPTPDTIAVEFVVPYLVGRINEQLARRGTAVLQPPPDTNPATLDALRHAVRHGRPVPDKLWHSLEVLGTDVRHARTVAPTDGRIGGSPAATAAWVGECTDGDPAAHGYLTAMAARYGGPVPSIQPISIFERAWVLTTLAAAGVPTTPVPGLVAYLDEAVGDLGAPAGYGLPADSDDTAAALHALALAGRPRSVESLFRYQADGYFHCFLGERTPSTSTNAHVLDALLDTTAPGDRQRRQAAAATITGWLLDVQESDGSWWDKWHASPYYATACCAAALARTGGPAAYALDRAARWTLATQRPDGSWGRWEGTVEETAYAVQILSAVPTHGSAVDQAIAQAGGWLREQPDDGTDWPPLWHDKDLYTPVSVVRAARIAALHLAAGRHAGRPASALVGGR